MNTLTKAKVTAIFKGPYSQTQFQQFESIGSIDIDRLDCSLSVNDGTLVHGILDQGRVIESRKGRPYILLQFKGSEGWAQKVTTTVNAVFKCDVPGLGEQSFPLQWYLEHRGLVFSFLLKVRGRYRNADTIRYHGKSIHH